MLVGSYVDFFPLREHDTPLPTVMKRRDFKGNLTDQLKTFTDRMESQFVEDAGGRKRSIFGLSDVMFFMPRVGGAVSSEHLIEQVRGGLLRFNLKWDEGPQSGHMVAAYLRQLMIMIAAELAEEGVHPAKISWPFPTRRRSAATMRGHSQTVRDGLVKSLSAEARGTGESMPVYMTEGEAACELFPRSIGKTCSRVSARCC